MSLIHWWPLNGDLENKGIENGSGTWSESSNFSNDGKIGGCAECNSSHCLTLPITETTGNYSISFWIKIPTAMASNTSWELVVLYDCYQGNSADSTYIDWANYQNLKIYDDAGHQYWWLNSSDHFSYDTWFHITLVHTTDDTQTTKLYINGVYRDIKTSSTALRMRNGNMILGSGVSVGSVYFNDVRIYDHALSAKEVKEISKGLVLHYDFNDPYVEETTNLADQSWYTRWDNSGSGTINLDDTSIPASPTGTKIFSNIQTVEGQSALGVGITGDLPSKTITASCWFYKSGTPTSNTIGPLLRGWEPDTWYVYLSYNGNTNFREWPSDQWLYITGTTTTNSDQQQVYICCYTGGLNEKFAFSGWQIEEKNHATPYVNGARSAGTVFDSSGYGYNGTQKGEALQIVTDSASGKYSAKFDTNGSGTSWIDVVGVNLLNNFSNISYCAWVYQRERTSDRACICIGNCYFTISDVGLLSGYAYGKNPEGYHTGTQVIPLNTWTHIAIVWDDSYIYGYINGVQDFKIATSGTISSMSVNIGKESGYYRQFKGSISDFKIYATALSASDILAEYQRKAAIDKNGDLYTGQFIENGWSGKPVLTLEDLGDHGNGIYVDKTSWADTIIDTTIINNKLQPSTTYYIRYKIQRLAYPISHSYTAQAWACAALYNYSNWISCAGLSEAVYTALEPGDCIWVTGSFTTPSSLSSYRMIFYSARWSGSNSDWNTNAEVETVRLSDFCISSTAFTTPNINISKKNIVYCAEIQEENNNVNLCKTKEIKVKNIKEI